jgi:hypothetical protein
VEGGLTEATALQPRTSRGRLSAFWIVLVVSIVGLGVGTVLIIPRLQGDQLIAATATLIAAVISALVGAATVASTARQHETEQLRLSQEFEIEQTRLGQEKAIEENRLGRQATLSAIEYLSGESSQRQKEAALMVMCKLGDVGIALLLAAELPEIELAARTRLVLLSLETGETSRVGPAVRALGRLSHLFGEDELGAFNDLIGTWPPKEWDPEDRWLFVNNFFKGLSLERETAPSDVEMAMWTQSAAMVLRSEGIREREMALAVLRACEPYKEEWDWSEFTGFEAMQEYFEEELGKNYGDLTTPHAKTIYQLTEQALRAWWGGEEVAEDPTK